jgi:hypothetical protein
MNSSYKNGLTALAGGGQSGATPIGNISGNGDAVNNRFTTVANAGDSAILPLAAPGLEYRVFNQTTTSMNVFPAVGDAINGGSANAAFAVAANKGAIFVCMVAGFWNAILSA